MWGGECKKIYNVVVIRGIVGMWVSMVRIGVFVFMVVISGSISISGGSISSGCVSVVRIGVGVSVVVGNFSIRISGGRNRGSKVRFMSIILDYKVS